MMTEGKSLIEHVVPLYQNEDMGTACQDLTHL